MHNFSKIQLHLSLKEAVFFKFLHALSALPPCCPVSLPSCISEALITADNPILIRCHELESLADIRVYSVWFVPCLKCNKECCSHHRLRQGSSSAVLGISCVLPVIFPSCPLNEEPLNLLHLFILRVGHTNCSIWMEVRGQLAGVSYFLLPREPWGGKLGSK